MADHTPFLTVFPGCAPLQSAAGGLEKAWVTEVLVNTAERSLSVSARFAAMPSPVDLHDLTERLRRDYGLNTVTLNPDYPPTTNTVTLPAETGHVSPGDVLMGRSIRQSPVPLNTVTLESGRVTVQGEVISVTSRELAKRGAAILSFDITDKTSSIRVTH